MYQLRISEQEENSTLQLHQVHHFQMMISIEQLRKQLSTRLRIRSVRKALRQGMRPMHLRSRQRRHSAR